MKFVYVLISDGKDFYPEQLLISILSLKKHNPLAEVVVITDRDTKESLEEKKSLILETDVEFVEVVIPNRFNKKCRSRYLKTTLPEYLKDSFLYIDSDTVINGDLTEVEKFEYDLGAVYDRNENGEFNRYMELHLNKSGIEDIDKLVFFNGGVIFARNSDNTRNFFKDWHRLWLAYHEKLSLEIDQISLLKTNQLNGNIIQPLPGYYNCQVAFQPAIKYLSKAKIIHYIADYKEMKIFPLENEEVLLNIRKNGITSIVGEIINNPVEIFLQDKFIINSREKKLYDSNNVVLAKELTRYYPWTNKPAHWVLTIWAFLRLIKSKFR
ncbi:MAG: hypothetical protein J1F38_08210 [Muribaculaceae bacterium]|nr:hypothetical protein [Muribaculaceae bacterium]